MFLFKLIKTSAEKSYCKQHYCTPSLSEMLLLNKTAPNERGLLIPFLKIAYWVTVLGGGANSSIAFTSSARGLTLAPADFFLPKPMLSSTSVRLSKWIPRAGSTPFGQDCEQAPAM